MINTLKHGFLKFAYIPLGGIEIKCWGYSTVLGTKVQLQILHWTFSSLL